MRNLNQPASRHAVIALCLAALLLGACQPKPPATPPSPQPPPPSVASW